MNIPFVPLDLLGTLRRLYPDRLARTPQSDFDQGRAVGRQDVIDKLQAILDKEADRGGPKDLL